MKKAMKKAIKKAIKKPKGDNNLDQVSVLSVAIGNIDICYGYAGTGPKLLYIGGTGADLRRRPNALTSPLVNGFEILSFDQRGLGQSDKPDEPYTMADYGDDAAGLLDAVGWENCFVIGVSFGGMVAQELAIRHPEKISKLVLCCTSTGGEGGSSYPLHEIQDLPVADQIAFRLSRNDLRIDEAWIASNAEAYEEMFDKAKALAAVGADDPRRKVGSRRQLEARAGHDTWDRIQNLSLPVLVCGGKFDGQASTDVVENLARRIPGAELKFFDGGHLFLQQDPMAFDAIKAFFDAEKIP